MKTVKVHRSELLKTVVANRKNHKDTVEEALRGYRKEAIRHLEQIIGDARSGKPIRRSLAIVEPQDHTRDYDRVIKMLEMSTETVIELTGMDFGRYVLDDWEWRDAWIGSTSSYTGED